MKKIKHISSIICLLGLLLATGVAFNKPAQAAVTYPTPHNPWLKLAAVSTASRAIAQPTGWLDAYREPAKRLIDEAMANDFAWQRLALLTDTAGHRLSGSPELDRAIDWAVRELRRPIRRQL